MAQQDNLQESIKLANASMEQLERQMQNVDNLFNATINKLEGEQRQKIVTLQGMTNRAIAKAKKGGDYNEVLEQIKKTFKADINGGNGNKEGV